MLWEPVACLPGVFLCTHTHTHTHSLYCANPLAVPARRPQSDSCESNSRGCLQFCLQTLLTDETVITGSEAPAVSIRSDARLTTAFQSGNLFFHPPRPGRLSASIHLGLSYGWKRTGEALNPAGQLSPAGTILTAGYRGWTTEGRTVGKGLPHSN
jgi:hypothetical protein